MTFKLIFIVINICIGVLTYMFFEQRLLKNCADREIIFWVLFVMFINDVTMAFILALIDVYKRQRLSRNVLWLLSQRFRLVRMIRLKRI